MSKEKLEKEKIKSYLSRKKSLMIKMEIKEIEKQANN